MNARMLGIICALLAAMPNLIGCEGSRSQDYQFEKQVKRAQECRQLQEKLVGEQLSLSETPYSWRTGANRVMLLPDGPSAQTALWCAHWTVPVQRAA